jgi:hypothetical protein
MIPPRGDPGRKERRMRVGVRTLSIAVVGVSAMALAVSGCFGGSDAEAEGPVDISQLRDDLEERFGTPGNEAPWYRRITAINWANGHLEVTTDFTLEEYKASGPGAGRPTPTCVETFKLASAQLAEPDETALIVAVIGPGGVALGSCG